VNVRLAGQMRRIAGWAIATAMVMGWGLIFLSTLMGDEAEAEPFAIAGCVAMALAVIVIIARIGLPDDTRADEGTIRDRQQRQWVTTMAAQCFGLLAMALISSRHLWQVVHGDESSLWVAVVFGPVVALLSFVLLWRGLEGKQAKFLDDELMRAYHANAMGWGFASAFVGLCVVFGLMIWREQVALAAMPVVMWATIAVASVRLWWQVRRADG
jgi:hypothetical protein